MLGMVEAPEQHLMIQPPLPPLQLWELDVPVQAAAMSGWEAMPLQAVLRAAKASCSLHCVGSYNMFSPNLHEQEPNAASLLLKAYQQSAFL